MRASWRCGDVREQSRDDDHQNDRQRDVCAVLDPALGLGFGAEAALSGKSLVGHFQRLDSSTFTVTKRKTAVVSTKKTILPVSRTPLLKSVYRLKTA